MCSTLLPCATAAILKSVGGRGGGVNESPSRGDGRKGAPSPGESLHDKTNRRFDERLKKTHDFENFFSKSISKTYTRTFWVR